MTTRVLSSVTLLYFCFWWCSVTFFHINHASFDHGRSIMAMSMQLTLTLGSCSWVQSPGAEVNFGGCMGSVQRLLYFGWAGAEESIPKAEYDPVTLWLSFVCCEGFASTAR